MTVVAGTPSGPVVISSCEVEFEGRIGPNGEGYFHTLTLTAHGGGTPCTRTACDEAAPSHATIPWRFHLREVSVKRFRVFLCLRSSVSAEGTAGTPCELDIPVTDTGTHAYAVDATSGAACLNLPAGAVTIFGRWHFETGPSHPPFIIIH